MARIEKTVFISYRRADVYTALAVYQDLKNHGYDVFFDYRSISSGDFEQIITSNIRARAHFLLILTPTALDRLNDPGDWLKREIETAIDEKRNIIPLFFKGFQFGPQSVSDTLTGKLRSLSRYNGLNVHEDYFEEAMHRLRSEFLNKPLDTVLHPVSNTIQKIVKEEQIAADKALEQIENVQELVKIAEEKPAREREAPQPVVSQVAAGDAGKRPRAALQKPSAEKTPSLPPDRKSLASRFNLRVLLGIGALLAVVSLGIAVFPALKSMIAPEIGSTRIGEDGMILLYVPGSEFTMGNDTDSDDEKPVHPVTLDAFWIDKTEVTNKMYSQCVETGVCEEPTNASSYTHSSYYGNSEFDDYPVIYVNWNMAKTYCEWADRRLPTEAEWEKAARGTDGNVYPWGNSFDGTLVNFCDINCSFDWADKSFDDKYADVAPVGSYPSGKSIYGALDMTGNVWELVSSLYQPYPYDPADGRENLTSSDVRALRGGSWDVTVYEVRSARRSWYGPSNSDDRIGFRCAVSANRQADITPLAQASTNIPSAIQASQPTKTETPSPAETLIPATPTLGIGSTLTGEDGMTLLYVPAGEFTMGSDGGKSDEKPVHQVTLEGYWIDINEVTVRMYSLCVEAGICQEPTNSSSDSHSSYFGNTEFDEYPVIYVNWTMAKTYCEWADRRLPTEAEWEKAARGENANVYPWGNTFNGSLVNFCDTNCTFNWADTSSDDGFADVGPVGKYPNGASIYGAYDMAGNVWEWVNDWYSETYYSITPSPNPKGPNSGQYRVLRGGSWVNDSFNVRSSDRNSVAPAYTLDSVGFRCAMSSTP